MNGLPNEIPWSTTATVSLGLLAIVMIIGALLWVWNEGKKAFGRTPPLYDELEKRDKALRKMIFASEGSLKERMNRLEQRYEEMQLDRERKWTQLQADFKELSNTLSYIRGKLDEQEKEELRP